MSYADYLFVKNCEQIITSGTTDEMFKVRPRWLDGTPAHTKMCINVCDQYELTPTSIPVMTLRKTGVRNAIDEILWIYQRHSNNVKDLASHIWDSWAAKSGDDIGSIGKAYGYQIGKRYRHHKYTVGENLDDYPSAYVSNSAKEAVDSGMDPEGCSDTDWVWLDQIDGVIWSLRNNPADRAIMTNMYNHADIADMHLRPCAYGMTFNVTVNSDGQKVLNGLLNQRSQDMLTANNWNVVQYSILIQMLAQVCGMVPGKFTHMVANMHIYDRHIPIIQTLIGEYASAEAPMSRRYDIEHMSPLVAQSKLIENCPYPNPTFWMNPDIKNFYDFKVSDFELQDYKYLPFDMPIEVAV